MSCGGYRTGSLRWLIRRGLSGFIGSEHDVNVRFVGGEFKHRIGEPAIPEQIKAADTHGLLSFLRDPRGKIATCLVNQACIIAVNGSLQDGILGVSSNFMR